MLLTENCNKNSYKSAINYHVLQKGHSAKCENSPCLLNESPLINKDQPEVNKHAYSYPWSFLSNCYAIIC